MNNPLFHYFHVKANVYVSIHAIVVCKVYKTVIVFGNV